MSKCKEKCSVVGCKDQHKTLHRLPAAEEKRAAWIEFIFEASVPAEVGKNLLVCADHFDADCFTNLDQYKAGVVGSKYTNNLLCVPVDKAGLLHDVLCVLPLRTRYG